MRGFKNSREILACSLWAAGRALLLFACSASGDPHTATKVGTDSVDLSPDQALNSSQHVVVHLGHVGFVVGAAELCSNDFLTMSLAVGGWPTQANASHMRFLWLP